MHRPSNYRPDIDGLRAIAVVSVILFHYDFERFAGGFVGVDVFFVISGFLITRLIVADLDAGRFSFAQFYVRRARRLFPALFATLALSLGVGTLLFTPEHLEILARSLVAALASVSNIVFWKESGYFDPGGHVKPLLHTWSLAVEEQFYLVWPLAAVVLWKLGRARLLVAVLALSAILSLLATERWLAIDPTAAFYLAPFRVVELSVGALCVWAVRAPPGRRWIAEGTVALGLVAIAYAILAFDQRTPFPGRMALVPCLGTAAIIYAGAGSRLGALLGNALAVRIGLISYSLYLVHWPLYVFYRYWTLDPLTRVEQLFLIATAFVLATLMYTRVEQPFRVAPRGEKARSGRRVALAWASLALLLAVPASSAWRSAGWPWRVPREVATATGDLRAFNAARDRAIRVPECHMSQGFDRFASSLPRCLELRDDRPNLLVIGDSHAADLWFALRQAYPDVNFLQATGAGCAPVERYFPAERHDCRRLLQAVKRDFSGLEDLDGIVMSARWRGRVEELREEIAHYRGRGIPVVVFGPVAEYDPSVRLLFSHHGRRAGFAAFAERFRSVRVTQIDRAMDAALNRAGIPYVSKIDVYCGTGACPLVDQSGKLLIQDYGHWGVAASGYFARQLARRFDEAEELFSVH